MADQRVVAVLGVGVVPAETPILRADDLGILRGDGIFETMHVRGGQAWLLDEHLDRMARSAARMGLDLPDRAALVELVGQCLVRWPSDLEGALRLVCTRGGEHGGPATVFATVAEVGPTHRRARDEGITVVTASFGPAAGPHHGSAWLTHGAKTISYAVNMASLRWAATLGADDVLWVSADGFALEAPTSTLVWRVGDTLHSVPVEQTGILAGTTAAYLLAHAAAVGLHTTSSMVTPAELLASDGAWFTSSVRGIAAIRRLDGAEMPHSDEVTGQLRKLLGFV